MNRLLLAGILAALLIGPVGCGGPAGVVAHVPVPEKWVNELITQIVQWIEDGTGIDIEKGDVKVKTLGVRKQPDGSAHLGDFAVTVNYRNTEFGSTPKDVPCNADGIPNDEGNRRIKDAVEEIKRTIRAAR